MIHRIVAGALALATLLGCSGGADTAKETKEMRNALTTPQKFDMNNVPPQYRDKVRAMIGGGGASSKGAGGAPGR